MNLNREIKFKIMRLRFAFAVNSEKRFEKMHFGDADRFLIYTVEAGKLIFSSEEINNFKFLDEEFEHGSKRKGNAIISFLKEKDVNVLVSTQFGKNINLINKHFIPVRISIEQQDEIIDILKKHLHWIMDECENKSSGYKLFTIKSGILKSPIDK
ncbi:NifB/NifX family molybdenum-iron cluster-binding protein [bacterium]|nr:NifB/NifX family molybdenum-iron cluster-binding protein [bacterium]